MSAYFTLGECLEITDTDLTNNIQWRYPINNSSELASGYKLLKGSLPATTCYLQLVTCIFCH